MQKSPRIKENIIQVFPQKIKQRALSNSVASSNL